LERKITEYEADKEQKKEIEEKIKELLELCQINRIPMFLSVALQNDKNGTKYKNIMYSAKVHDIRLTDDQIEKHILISNGFCAVPKREAVEIDTDVVSRLFADGEDAEVEDHGKI
jgi:hypothetical protein